MIAKSNAELLTNVTILLLILSGMLVLFFFLFYRYQATCRATEQSNQFNVENRSR